MSKKNSLLLKVFLVLVLSLSMISMCIACDLFGNNTPADTPKATCDDDDHSFGEWKVITQATCTVDGEKQRTCSVCGKVETADILATGHTYGSFEVITPASCQKDGLREKVCSKCGDTVSEVISRGHTIVSDEAVAPTCTKTGLTKGSHCSVCNTVIEAQKEVAMVAHKVTVQHAEISATCVKEGTKLYYSCSVCNKKFYSADDKKPVENDADLTIAKVSHVLTKKNAKASTCKEQGNKACYACANCNKCFEDAEGTKELTDAYLPLASHTLKMQPAITPTCTTEGRIQYWYCTVCDKLFSKSDASIEITDKTSVVLPVSHGEENIVKVVAKDATCTTAGNTGYYKCKKCNKLYEDADCTKETSLDKVTLKALGHKMEKKDAVTVKCYEDKGYGKGIGIKAHNYCTVCQRYFDLNNTDISYSGVESLFKTTYHNVQYIAKVDATCAQEGVKAHWVCQNDGCGCMFSTQQASAEVTAKDLAIAKVAHKPNQFICQALTDCSFSASFKYYYCEDCKGTFDDADCKTAITVTANHVFDEDGIEGCKNIVAKDPTCTETGNKGAKYCKTCQYYYTTDTKGNYVIPFKTTSGYANGSTSASYFEIPALGHDCGYFKTVEATCTQVGYHGYYQCGRCQAYFTNTGDDDAPTLGVSAESKEAFKIDAKGHCLSSEYIITSAKPATCLEKGRKAYSVCKDCKEHVEADKDNDGDVIAKLRHVYDENGVCQGNGLAEGQECGHTLTYTVEFVGANLPKQTVKYGEQFSFPVVNKENYYFVGWVLEGGDILLTNSYGKGIDGWKVVCATISGEKEVKSYAMTWWNHGTIPAGNMLEKLMTSTKANVLSTEVLSIMDEDVEGFDTFTVKVQPKFDTNVAVVKYTNTNGCENNNPLLVGAEKFTLAPLSGRRGYNFAGWKLSGTEQIATDVTGSTVLSGQTYVAQWEAIKYTLTLNYNGNGTATEEIDNIAYDTLLLESITESATKLKPTWTNKTFLGWYQKDEKGNFYAESFKITEKTKMDAGDLVLYAKWTNYEVYAAKYDTTITCLKASDIYQVAKDGSGNLTGAHSANLDALKDQLTVGEFVIDATLFNAYATDNAGNECPVLVKVALNTPGTSPTLRFVSVGSFNQRYVLPTTAEYPIYSAPVFSYADDSKSTSEPKAKLKDRGYITATEINENKLASTFGYSAKDSFGRNLTISAFVGKLVESKYVPLVAEDYTDSTTEVVAVFSVSDNAGNVSEEHFTVDYYTLPVVSCTLKAIKPDFVLGENKANIKSAITVADTQGEALTEYTFEEVTGYTTVEAGKVLQYKVTATDSKGNKVIQTIAINVLSVDGMYYDYSTTANFDKLVSLTEANIVEKVQPVIKDSCGCAVTTITVKESTLSESNVGTNGAKNVTVTLVATDDAGNEKEFTISLRKFAEEDFEAQFAEGYSANIKKDYVATAEGLGIYGTDSFGNKVKVTLTLSQYKKKGEADFVNYDATEGYVPQGGDEVKYTVSGKDRAGNELEDIVTFKIYDGEDIKFTHNDIEDNSYIKIGSKGAEFNIRVTDSFDQELGTDSIVILNAGNKELVAGQETTIIVSATDNAGNVKELAIPGVKIYGDIQVTFTKHDSLYLIDARFDAETDKGDRYYDAYNNNTFGEIFSFKDSFGNVLDGTVALENTTISALEEETAGIIEGTSVIKATLNAADGKGNMITNQIVYIPLLAPTQSLIVYEVSYYNATEKKVVTSSKLGVIAKDSKEVFNPEIANYAFKGYKMSGITVTEYIQAETKYKLVNAWSKATGVYKLVATLEANETTLNYTTTEAKTKKVAYGATTTIDVPSAQEGKKFVGWTMDSVLVTDENGTLLEPWSVQASEKNLVARFDDLYTFNFYAKQTKIRTVVDTGIVNKAVKPSASEMITGYIFDGWLYNGILVSDEEGTINSTFELTSAKVYNFYMSYEISKSVVKLYYGDEMFGEPQVVTFGEEFSFNVPGEGYAFQGWYYDGNALTDANGVGKKVWNLTDDEVILTAEAHMYEYTIEYNLNGGAFKKEYTDRTEHPTVYTAKTTGVDGFVLSAPTKDGSSEIVYGYNYTSNKYTVTTKTVSYVFGGWYTDVELKNSISVVKLTSGNLVLYAKWTKVESEIVDTYDYVLRDTDNDGTADHINYGRYPQELVTDETLNEELNTESPIVISGSGSWSTYTNYGEKTTMFYKDIGYKGEMYRGVYIVKNRANKYGDEATLDTTYQDNNGYSNQVVYWFKYVDISWSILSVKNGQYVLISDCILDAQNMSNDTGLATFMSNFIGSCDIPDKQDVTTGEYDFSTSSSASDTARRKKTTDYAQIQNAYTDANGYGVWWLNTKYLSFDSIYYYVATDGTVTSRDDIACTYYGVVVMQTLDKSLLEITVKE